MIFWQDEEEDTKRMTGEEKKQEGLKRLHALAVRFDLGEALEGYFREDKLYYSYAYSMDTIQYDKRYAEAVKRFEKVYDCLVYHVIETETAFGTLLSLLFVSGHRSDWKAEKLSGDRILSYSFVVENGWNTGEFGSITMAAPMGYLMRTQ